MMIEVINLWIVFGSFITGLFAGYVIWGVH